MSGPDISEDTHDVTLKEERVVVGKEHIEVEGDGTPRRRS